MNNNIKILQNGGGWVDNIGNAFIDFGCNALLKKAIPESKIHLTSVFPRWMFHNINRGIKDILQKNMGDRSYIFNIQDYANVDYIVQCGAFLSKGWFDLHGETLLKLQSKGIRLIINGGGMGETAYTEEGIEKTRKYLKKLNPYIFISRDEKSFESFKDLAEYSYNGIDVGFFVKDYYEPLNLDIPDYATVNFDKVPEPDLNIDPNLEIIRTHQAFWFNFPIHKYPKMKKSYYNKENTLISEIPDDYLNLYANTSVTYSDRVHSCVATFSYGHPAQLFGETPRSLLFDRIGASKIKNKVIHPSETNLEKEKGKQVQFLSEILNSKSE
jgi:hypothetical protein